MREQTAGTPPQISLLQTLHFAPVDEQAIYNVRTLKLSIYVFIVPVFIVLYIFIIQPPSTSQPLAPLPEHCITVSNLKQSVS